MSSANAMPRIMRRAALQALPVLFALLLLPWPGDAEDTAPAPPILLGINYPLTGPYSVEGLDQIRAARMAVDAVNDQGGVLGRMLRLVPMDSASDVLITQRNVTRLIDAGCSMIFGGSSSAVAVAASDICQRRKVLFFGTLTYSMDTTVSHGHRYAFRECNDSWMAASLMADWLKQHFADKRYAFVTADYTWGWSTEKSLRQVADVTDENAHPSLLTPLGETDFRSTLAAIAAREPDVLVLVLFGKDLAHALRQAADMGLKEQMQIVVPNLTLGMAERTGASALEGVVGTLPWTWKVPAIYDHPRGLRFVEEFVKRYRRYPSTSGASAYTIVHQYKDAVQRAGTTNPVMVIEALEGHSFELLKDRQTWRALDHQNVQTMFMVRGNSLDQALADPLRQDFFTIIGRKDGESIALSPQDWKRRRLEAGKPPQLEPLR